MVVLLWFLVLGLPILMVGIKLFFILNYEDTGYSKKLLHNIMVILGFIELFLIICTVYTTSCNGQLLTVKRLEVRENKYTPENNFNVSFRESTKSYYNLASLTQENIDNFAVNSYSRDGYVMLKLSQGDIEKTFDISNCVAFLDISEFEVGTVNFEIYNQGARDVIVNVHW